ncbi:hypothetical protein [Streptomyces carpaticus]|uniref:Rubredoxin n=1 Tax=Streptomyces carpaticus TaxID=285558 RepID=A0ABV4ZJF6_9ACTN
MEFDFECWRCWANNTIYGEPTHGFWRDRYKLPADWNCWNCGAVNTTPDD